MILKLMKSLCKKIIYFPVPLDEAKTFVLQ